MKSTVLFDMDGVIVDSEDYWVDFQREDVLPSAVPDSDVELSEIAGMNFREMYDFLDKEYGTVISREEWIERFDTASRKVYMERATLLEGFRDLLETLHRYDTIVGLVSSSPHRWIDMALERFSLQDEFAVTVSADDIPREGKPSPEVYEYAATELGVSPMDCIVIEDSTNGIVSATKAGMFTVAYRIDTHDNVNYSLADVVVDKAAELREEVLERTMPVHT